MSSIETQILITSMKRDFFIKKKKTIFLVFVVIN
jgi:hypothetical protein